VKRKDGPNGDKAFNGNTLPEASRPILPADTVTTDYTYSAVIPRVTSTSGVRFVARTDGSAENVLMKLDGGIDLNGTVPVGNTDPALRDQSARLEQRHVHGLRAAELHQSHASRSFSPRRTRRECSTGSAGCGDLHHHDGHERHAPKFIDADTAAFLYHDPAAPVGNLTPARNQYDAAAMRCGPRPTASAAATSIPLLHHRWLESRRRGRPWTGTTKVVEMLYPSQ
jgi:hypothetical protein